jgi:hypothetical protein
MVSPPRTVQSPRPRPAAVPTVQAAPPNSPQRALSLPFRPQVQALLRRGRPTRFGRFSSRRTVRSWFGIAW